MCEWTCENDTLSESTDADIAAGPDFDSQLEAFEESHSKQRRGAGLIDRNAPTASVPGDSSVEDVKHALAAIGQERETSSAQWQFQRFDDVWRQAEPTIEAGVDHRLDLQSFSRRTMHEQFDDGLTVGGAGARDHEADERSRGPKRRA